MWGFSQVLPVNTFKDSNNGYLYDGDHCEFGVDVTTPTVFKAGATASTREAISAMPFSSLYAGITTDKTVMNVYP